VESAKQNAAELVSEVDSVMQDEAGVGSEEEAELVVASVTKHDAVCGRNPRSRYQQFSPVC
jgi:hypothetical protein